MEIFVVALLLGAFFLVRRVWGLPDRLDDLQQEITHHKVEHGTLRNELQELRAQLAEFREAGLVPAAGFRASAAPLFAPPIVVGNWGAAAAPVAPEPPVVAPEPEVSALVASPTPAMAEEPEPAALASEEVETATPTVEATPAAAAEAAPFAELLPATEPTLETEPAAEPSPAPEMLPEALVAPEPALTLATDVEADLGVETDAAEPEVVAEPEPATEPELIAESEQATDLIAEPAAAAEPELAAEPSSTSEPEVATEPELAVEPEPATVPEPTRTPADEPAPTWAPQPRPVGRATPPPRKPILPRRPAPKPVPTGPTWWERASTTLLENWTGILGAVVLVTGVGFLGIYAALRVSPQLRFLMICAFAAGLLGARVALREKAFAQKLNAWLVSSAAAIFLFACVGSVSIEGLRWVTAPFDYLLLLAGVSANLYLAWRTSRQEVATLHGVLSLVALAVLPPTALTLGAAAGVTAFSIAITYRQHWKYQLLLSIVSFFAFHLYWHQELPALSSSLRLTAMALVLLVGGAAAVVQYRSVYAQRKFEPLLFTAHLLNWTCLGINLYLYSTGSVWKTIPLAVGSVLTFWAGRRAKQLGIGWLFQTDTIISLILALATALSLQGWHATPTVIGLFMLLETLLITLVMARQGELLVYRVALAAALLASAGLLGITTSHLASSPPVVLYREVLVLALAGWAGLAFVQFILKQRLLRGATAAQAAGTGYQSPRHLLNLFAGLTGLLQLGAGLGLARVLFGWSSAPVGFLLLGLAAAALALATWVYRSGRAPSWVRWQQLVVAQVFVGVAILGLHEAGVSWSAVLLLLYIETLVVILLLAGRVERDGLHKLIYRAALGEAAVAGLGILLRASIHLGSSASVLYRETLVLALAGWATLAFVQLAAKWPLLAGVKPYPTNSPEPAQLVSNHQAHTGFLSGLAVLGGVLQTAAGIALSRLVIGGLVTTAAWPLSALVGMAVVSLGLARWVRTAGRAPSWVRWQQLVLAQFYVLLALLGLHELGLNWSAVLLLVYLETMLVAFVLAGRAAGDALHRLLYRAALVEAAVAGLGLLLRASSYLAHGTPAELYREALILAVAGWLSVVFGQLTFKWSLLPGVKPYLPRFAAGTAPGTLLSNPAEHRRWVTGFTGFGGGLQALAGFALLRVLSEWAGAPVALLLGALLALAGIAVGLATWVRSAGLLPGWVRWQQLVLAQVLVLSALFGLHKLGLNWSAVLLLTYVETLLVALLLAGRAASDFLHQQLYRAALAEAALVGLSILLRAASFLPHGVPAVLYHEVLVVALAGWVSLAFAQLAFKWSLLAAVKPYVPHFFVGEEEYSLHLVSNPEENRNLVNCFAGFGGVLQAVAGLGLGRLLFGWSNTPTLLVLGLLVALAASSLGLAKWVRTAGQLPGWVRWQQLVLGQLLGMLALAGLHEVGLSWSTVLLLLFGENLLVALLLAGRAASDHLHTFVYRAALAEALGTGASLVLVVGSHVASARLSVLYYDALVLALAGWAALGFVQAALKWPLLRGVRPYLPGYEAAALDAPSSTQLVSNHEAHLDLLHSFAGLAGVLQLGAGLVLARVLFGWVGAPVAGLLGALGLLAVITLGLGLWLRATPALPKWMRRQQLVLTQVFAVIAVVGLHQLGLSWPGILSVLYAESLVVALLLSGRDEDDLLHVQTYLLVVQALVLPLLVRYTSLGALGLGARAALLVGAALLTLGYQARRLYWRRTQDDFARLTLASGAPLPALGLAVGWLLLGAGALVYGQSWAAWPTMALLGALLYLRQRVALPGLWAGLMLAGVGYLGLQWHHVLSTHSASYSTGYVLLYLLPTLAVPVAGLLTSWWPTGERYVRWPWLYLLGAHLVVALVAAVPAGHVTYLMLGLLALGGASFGAALAWRRALPDAAAVVRAGLPDRYLLHLGYAGVLSSLLLQGWLMAHHESLLGLRADYLTAGLFFVVVAAVALARPPATEPVYASWKRLHPWLPEVALLFGSATLAHDVRTPGLPLVWVLVALLLGGAAPRLALRFRRLGLYGRLYYWLAAGTASVSCLLTFTPSQLLSADWWALTAAVVLLFGYVALALRQGNALFARLSPAWSILALPARHQLETWLLYPAFMALAVLLIQSFDRSVLTVLLMLQVVAVFSGSLALRRQDLRYVALAGMLGCMGRLLFFDLRQSGTVTRAVVFIFMGLLLLGMNALYARFKSRFEPTEENRLDLDQPNQPDLDEDKLAVDLE
jgi:hypothetical protein